MAEKGAAKKPRPPSDLAAAGRAVWSAVVGTHELDPHEAALLHLAARQADDVALLEALIADGLMVPGSTGQMKLTPAVSEARQGRLAVGRLLAQLALPAEEGEVPMTEASKRAKHASDVRWAGQRAADERRRQIHLHRAGGADGAA